MVKIELAAEDAFIIYFGDKASPELSDKIAFYTHTLKKVLADQVVDLIPSYCSLFIRYRIDLLSYEECYHLISSTIDCHPFLHVEKQSERLEIPVFYDTRVGPDLEHLLISEQLTLAELISLHSDTDYCVHAVGFSPAFAFLGELNERICFPRLTTPRVRIPAGSVGIADNQTAVYPIVSAGGWNIIARTPIDLSLNNPNNLTKFKIGQRVRFTPIDEQAYLRLGGQL